VDHPVDVAQARHRLRRRSRAPGRQCAARQRDGAGRGCDCADTRRQAARDQPRLHLPAHRRHAWALGWHRVRPARHRRRALRLRAARHRLQLSRHRPARVGQAGQRSRATPRHPGRGRGDPALRRLATRRLHPHDHARQGHDAGGSREGHRHLRAATRRRGEATASQRPGVDWHVGARVDPRWLDRPPERRAAQGAGQGSRRRP
jgi:hypothetical protein